MAMLAEPRQRKRYNLTPRGKALYEDDSRFGTKMLEKMGWSKGKGLGANLSGGQDFIRVRMRNNNEGLGFEDRDDHWTQHEQNFSGLLKTLNGETDGAEEQQKSASASDDEAPRVGFGFGAKAKAPKVDKLKEKISGESLEEKSKRSKARVHYKKFTKGKDLAQYSEKDLANIFGKKVIETQQENGLYEQFTAITVRQDDDNDKEEAEKAEEKEVNSNFGGVQTISTGLSVSDYFRLKMEAIKNRAKGKGANEEMNQKEEESKEAENCEAEEQGERKKKKKRKLETVEETPVEAVEEEVSKKKKRKKEKSKKNETEEEQEVVAQEESTVNNEDIEAPKKKKKKKDKKEQCEEVEQFVEAEKVEPDTTEGSKKKKKKKSKQQEKMENEDVALESNDATLSTTHSQSNDACEDINALPSSNEPSNEKKSKKKDKKSKKDVSAAVSDTLDDLLAKFNTYNVLTVSSFCAEKFRNCALDRFTGSSISHFPGYSFDENLQLNIVPLPNDEDRITKLWNCTLDKYSNADPKSSYHNYISQVKAARKSKQRQPRFRVKTWKRKNVFQAV